MRNKIENILRENNIANPPIDVESIAKNNDIGIFDIDLPLEVSGCIQLIDGKIAITLNANIHNYQHRRFSIAHELGHFFLENHSSLFVGKIHSSAIAASQDIYEVTANKFAAELLMPYSMFRMDVIKRPDTIKSMLELALIYDVSMTALIIRFINLNDSAVAVIISDGVRIINTYLSNEYKSTFGYINNREIPLDSFTGEFARCDKMSPGDVVCGSSDYCEWSDKSCSGNFNEQIMRLNDDVNYLTLLVGDDDIESDNYD